MKIGEFIKKYMEKKGMSQAELARRSSVPTSTLNSIITRNNDRVAIEMVLRICEVLECDIEEYINSMRDVPPERVPTMFAKKYNALDAHGMELVNIVLDKEYERCTAVPEEPMIEIKMSEYKVSAGIGCDLNEYEQWDLISIPDTPTARNADFALTISGNSMEPIYHDSDIVLVKKTNIVPKGDIGIFVVNGCGYIKKFGGDRLISLNAKYDDIVLNENVSFYCCGAVIGRI